MNNELKFFFRNLTLYYNDFRYSSYYPIIFPAIIAFFSIALFGVFVLPHFQNWFSIQNEIQEVQKRITTMRENSRILENINKVSVDEDYSLAVKALPYEKDFAGILQAITIAAVKSRTEVNDYSFSLGSVSNSKNTTTKSSLSPISINLILNGTIDNLVSFINEIEKSVPIAGVKEFDFSSNTAEVTIVFYMKELPVLKVVNSVPIAQLTQKDRDLLSEFRQWSVGDE